MLDSSIIVITQYYCYCWHIRNIQLNVRFLYYWLEFPLYWVLGDLGLVVRSRKVRMGRP